MQKIATIREAWEWKYPEQVLWGKISGFEFASSEKVKVPILADTVANFECCWSPNTVWEIVR